MKSAATGKAGDPQHRADRQPDQDGDGDGGQGDAERQQHDIGKAGVEIQDQAGGGAEGGDHVMHGGFVLPLLPRSL